VKSAFLLSLAALSLLGCKDRWRERADPARTTEDPEQVAIAQAEPIQYEKKGYSIKLTPRASYRITGYAVDTSTTLLDEWDFVMPVDVALVWGAAAKPAVLAHTSTHLSKRYVSYWYHGADISMPELASHIANNHLIPSTPAIEKALRRIKEGDLVTLRGRLVDVEIADAQGQLKFKSPTSLSRDDVGSGACEQIYVEDVEIDR